MILIVSCTKSRFSTTTRQYHDGKVVYMNHYQKEKIHLRRFKAKPVATLLPDAPANKTGTQSVGPTVGNTTDLIAASDNNFPINFIAEKRVGLTTSAFKPQLHDKNGMKVLKPIRKSVGKSDTTVKKADRKEAPSEAIQKKAPKTEKLGLFGFILSFLGIIPVVGIPFGILGIVFGAISLRKIKRNPEKYKGKGLAIAGMVVGFTMLIINVLMLVAAVNAVENTPTPSLNKSTTSCRV